MSFKSFSQNSTQANSDTKNAEQTPAKDAPQATPGVTPPNSNQDNNEVKPAEENKPK
ncbi:hypothetical protein ACG9XR_18965 [Acinetobacter guillouiae]|uniref:hypothetical protein n=1 Tax=Acinetobacter guillouiae TaxID=106649 RepID=UPI003AF78B26